jgi:long-chain fatty acid transport protein
MLERVSGAAVLLLVLAAPLSAGGFAFPWRGARSAGMGGACVAATDPTAVACNPGALALLPKKKGAAVGVTVGAFNESLYQGLPPGLGEGATAAQKTPMAFVPHAYITLPLGATAVLGTGLDTPYRMHTDWATPDTFVGRFRASSSELKTYDLTQTISANLGGIGVGAGVIYRSSSFAVKRNLQTSVAGADREIGRAAIQTDTERAFGWTAGVLVKTGPRFSFGLSHRSAIKTEYNGTGKLTQILTGDTQLDQLVAATLPLGQDLPVESSFTFPAQTTAGIAFAPSNRWLFAFDATSTSWGRTEPLAFVFPSTHSVDTTYNLGFDDTLAFRVGARWKFATGPQVRVGYAVEESPLPLENMTPFFPDADRTTITAGFGLDWLDVAVGWTTYQQRVASGSVEGFNGNFRGNSWTAMLTVTK